MEALRQKKTRMLAALTPNYDPAALEEPQWATHWFLEEEAGHDMSRYFPPTVPEACR